MDGLLVLAVLVLPIFLAFNLNKTRVWWLASALLGVLAVVSLATAPTPGHGAEGAMDSLAAGIVAIVAMILFAYAGLLIGLGAWARRRRARAARPLLPVLPTAIVRP